MCIVSYKLKFIFIESKTKFFSIAVAMVQNFNEAIGKNNKTWYG